MDKDRSVDSFIRSLRAGDPGATTEVFELYVDRLVAMARKRISLRLAGRIDPEDIVQSVFRTFFHRAKQGQFQFSAEDDICRILARITVHKTLRQVAHHQAGKRDASRDAGSGDESQDLVVNLLSKEPSPDEEMQLLDQMQFFLARLADEDRKILELRMLGFSTLEISKKLDITDRKIRRRMEIIRDQAMRDELLMPEE
jgi:DNA-directed RNA polymerase specialized sigma24 family protein